KKGHSCPLRTLQTYWETCISSLKATQKKTKKGKGKKETGKGEKRKASTKSTKAKQDKGDGKDEKKQVEPKPKKPRVVQGGNRLGWLDRADLDGAIWQTTEGDNKASQLHTLTEFDLTRVQKLGRAQRVTSRWKQSVMLDDLIDSVWKGVCLH